MINFGNKTYLRPLLHSIWCTPPEQFQKPAKDRASSGLRRASFQTRIPQNFSFFVFRGQHGMPRSGLRLALRIFLAGQMCLAA